MSNSEHSSVFKCALCPYSTRIRRNYKQHLRTHSIERPFKCSECPYKTKRMSCVKQHLKDVHLTQPETFPCPESGCSYAAKQKGNLTKHSKIHSGEKSYVCSHSNCNFSAIQKISLIQHNRVHTGEKPFVCQFESCSFATAHSNVLVAHTRTHTKEKPYKCPEANCGYSANQLPNLKRHQRQHHPKEGEELPSFKCPICDCYATTKGNLAAHIKSHSTEKPFACPVESCEYRCKYKKNLESHLKSIHSDEKQYKCELCPYRAKLRNSVTQHLKLVHSEPNFRPFKCPEQKCDSVSKTKGDLKRHLLTHKGMKNYACSAPNCSYRAITKHEVKRHETSIHSDERKENCPLCGFKFKLKLTLLNHLRTHTKETPFLCKTEGCDYRTNRSESLRQHTKRRHS